MWRRPLATLTAASRHLPENAIPDLPDWQVAASAGERADEWATFEDFKINRRGKPAAAREK